MFKSFIVCIMLLNYFLVVVVANITTTNAIKYTHAYNAESPYMHAADCQQRFYLQFDCFDKCNDVEQVNTPATPLSQYLFLLANGLDFHNLLPFSVSNKNYIVSIQLIFPGQNLSVTPGFASVDFPPPNLV